MKRVLRWAGTGLLFTIVALALTLSLLPPLLDRTYYRGPVSDHFDGERFYNPGEANAPRRSFALMARFFSGVGKAQWPERVAIMPTRAPATPDPRAMVATWIGHATVLVQTSGMNILTDPIFSDRASPFGFVGPKRVREPGVRLADLPKIDLIVVSHSHYDHMDLPSLKALWDRDRPVIVTSLGNDAILKTAGIGGRSETTDCGRCPGVEALDWGGDTLVEGRSMRSWGRNPVGPAPIAQVTVERNHHWSSRWGSDRNRALWSSFTINTPAGAIYHAGDTGFGDGRWAAEAAARGPVRLAILPIGAYEPRAAMKENHVNPAEAVRVFDQLRPAMALGVHWGTFQLTFEAIDAPVRELARVRGGRNFVVSEVGRPIAVTEIAR